MKARADGAAGIQQDAYAQRQFVCCLKLSTFTGALPSSSRPKFCCCMFLMDWFVRLSVTVKIRFTSMDGPVKGERGRRAAGCGLRRIRSGCSGQRSRCWSRCGGGRCSRYRCWCLGLCAEGKQERGERGGYTERSGCLQEIHCAHSTKFCAACPERSRRGEWRFAHSSTLLASPEMPSVPGRGELPAQSARRSADARSASRAACRKFRSSVSGSTFAGAAAEEAPRALFCTAGATIFSGAP